MTRILLRFSLSSHPIRRPPPFAQRPGDFKIVGPGGGGAMFRPVVSPHDENTVLVACDMTGAYITHDGGKSWRMFNLRGVAEFFVFDPHDKNVIYVMSTALWRSEDGGDTWKRDLPQARLHQRRQDELRPFRRRRPRRPESTRNHYCDGD